MGVRREDGDERNGEREVAGEPEWAGRPAYASLAPTQRREQLTELSRERRGARRDAASLLSEILSPLKTPTQPMTARPSHGRPGPSPSIPRTAPRTARPIHAPCPPPPLPTAEVLLAPARGRHGGVDGGGGGGLGLGEALLQEAGPVCRCGGGQGGDSMLVEEVRGEA